MPPGHAGGMDLDPRLATVLAASGGVFSYADARHAGVSALTLDGLVRRGRILRVRRGAYVAREAWERADADERYRLRVRAILRSRPGDAASHHAAVMLHGLATWGVDLDRIDLTGSVAKERYSAGLVIHPTSGREMLTDGWLVEPASDALAHLTIGSGVTPGVVSMDDALRRGACTLDDLRAAVARLPGRHRERVLLALALCDQLCESVGESRTRIVLHDLGIPFASQVDVGDERGFIGRVDFLVDGCVVVEFDGLVKYEGADGRLALAAEKQRESRLTDAGYVVVRLIWSDLANPAAVLRTIREAHRRATRLRRRQPA